MRTCGGKGIISQDFTNACSPLTTSCISERTTECTCRAPLSTTGACRQGSASALQKNRALAEAEVECITLIADQHLHVE